MHLRNLLKLRWVSVFALLLAGAALVRSVLSQPFEITSNAMVFYLLLNSEDAAALSVLADSADAPALTNSTVLEIIDIGRINKRSLGWASGNGMPVDIRDLERYDYVPSPWLPVIWRGVFPRAHKSASARAAAAEISLFVAQQIVVERRSQASRRRDLLAIWQSGRANHDELNWVTAAALSAVALQARIDHTGVFVFLDGNWELMNDYSAVYELISG